VPWGNNRCGASPHAAGETLRCGVLEMVTLNRQLPANDVLRTLRNGKRYRLRPPRAEDRPRVAECFENLSADSRRLRFFAVKKTLLDSEIDFLTLTDGHDHIAVAALDTDEGGVEGRMVGMARCMRLPAPPDSAELAVAVADDVQGSGLGRVLIEQLMFAADAQGIARFELEVLAENAGMRALAKHFGGTAAHQSDGMLHYRIPVQRRPVDATAADVTPPPDSWPWLAPEVVLGAMQEDWLESSDQAFRLGQGLVEELWQSLWDSWHPTAFAPTRRGNAESS
jgi:RimJ/RimL family protein N-acetyltransferase